MAASSMELLIKVLMLSFNKKSESPICENVKFFQDDEILICLVKTVPGERQPRFQPLCSPCRSAAQKRTAEM